MTKYEPKTKKVQRTTLLKWYGDPDWSYQQAFVDLVHDLTACEAALAEREAEIKRMQNYIGHQPCRCRYMGDGDTNQCARCAVLGLGN